MALAGAAGGVMFVTARPQPAGPTPWREALAVREQAPFPRTFDGVVIAMAPQRIVAASVLSADVLLAIAPRERIAGVHWLAADARYCESAAQAAALPVVGAEPEQLIAVRPDLVVVDEFSRAEVPLLLGSVGVAVLRTQSVHDFDDVADNVRRIGYAVGCDAAAETVVGELRARLQVLAAGAAAVADWRVMNLNGALDTYGSRSLLDAAVRAAGARHLPAEQGVGGYQKLDIETVLSWQPDALIVGVEPGQDAAMAAWLHQQPGLSLLPCVQRDRVLYLPNSLLGATSPVAVAIAERIQQQLSRWGHP